MDKQEIIPCSGCGSKQGRVRGSELCFNCYVAEKDKKIGVKEKRTISHEEDDIQKSFFTEARYRFQKLGKRLFAVPNGGARNKREAGRLKAQGVTRGVSDIILLIPNDKYNFLNLECKTPTGSQSEDQIQFQKEVEESGGLYKIFKSVEEGINILKEYLETTNYK